MSSRGTWGGITEIKALAHYLQRPIFLFSNENDGQIFQIFDQDLTGKKLDKDYLLLFYQGNLHYQYILAKTGCKIQDIVTKTKQKLLEIHAIPEEILNLATTIKGFYDDKKQQLKTLLTARLDEYATNHARKIRDALMVWLDDDQLATVVESLYGLKNSINSSLKKIDLDDSNVILKYGYESFEQLLRVIERNELNINRHENIQNNDDLAAINFSHSENNSSTLKYFLIFDNKNKEIDEIIISQNKDYYRQITDSDTKIVYHYVFMIKMIEESIWIVYRIKGIRGLIARYKNLYL